MSRNDLETKQSRARSRVPSGVLVISIGLYILLAYFAQLIEDDMPQVVTESEISSNNSEQFSEELALQYLTLLLGDDARVAGTPYHLQKTKDLKELIESVVANQTIPVRTDWQLTTSEYWLDYSTPFVNRYVNVSNVVAVLEGESGFYDNGTIGSSLLVNCHYDSVPYASGASDNGLFCAVMIELLYRLSRRETKLQHNVIFLFNGAEENPLEGSHAFLQHEWSKSCFNVINLDAGGMNGKPALFQVTDPRMLDVYSETTSRPNAQGMGEFLFSTGIVPSDTDFRIFRDFGDIYGVDIVFSKWGVVYHTPYDIMSLIKEGVVQNAGDMLMGLVVGAADRTSIEKEDAETAVYYDYINLFTITYSLETAKIIDLLGSLVGFVSVFYYLCIVGWSGSNVCQLLSGCVGRLFCTVFGLGLCAAFAYGEVATTVQLRYLANPWSAAAWWTIYVVGAIAASHMYDACTNGKAISRSQRVYQAGAATRLLLSIILLIMSLITSLVSVRYIFTVTLAATSIASIISMTLHKVINIRGWGHLMVDTILSVPTLLFIYSIALRLNALLIPVMGRSGTISQPDYIVAAINAGLVAVAATIVSGIELLFSRKRLFLVLTFLLVLCGVVGFLPLFPYQNDGPATQRHFWFHSHIITYDINGTETNRTSGVVITKNDALTLDYVLPALEANNLTYNYTDGVEEDCEKYVLCNLPLYKAKASTSLKYSMVLYTDPPADFDPTPSITLLSRNCDGDNCTLQFRMIGTHHNTLTFWPVSGVNITSWSYNTTVSSTYELQNLSVYMVLHSEATYSGPEGCYDDFTLNLTVPEEQQSETIIYISHHANKIYHDSEFTEEYINLLNAMPQYFSISSNLSIRKNYEF